MVDEPVKDLKREVFSTKLETEDNETVRDLRNEVVSTRLEAEPIEALGWRLNQARHSGT